MLLNYYLGYSTEKNICMSNDLAFILRATEEKFCSMNLRNSS